MSAVGLEEQARETLAAQLPGAIARRQWRGEALDVRTAGAEQPDVVMAVPGRELAQVHRVRLAGQARIASEEPG